MRSEFFLFDDQLEESGCQKTKEIIGSRGKLSNGLLTSYVEPCW